MARSLKRKRNDGQQNAIAKKRQVTPDEDGFDYFEDLEAGDVDMDAAGPEANNAANDENTEDEEQDEEEEWGGIGTADGTTQITSTDSSGKKKHAGQPTGTELRVIKEASDLYLSNTFKLQIDELLPNVRPKPSRTPPLERALFALHTLLSSLPSVPAQHPLAAAKSLSKKGVSTPYPLPQPTEDTNWTVAFEKPSDITVVGSWGNKISVKGKDGRKFGIDVAVEMPEDLFQEKDYLNGRFFHKRAFYLATIAAAVINPKSGLKMDALYDSAQDDPRLTVLVLRPQNDDQPHDYTKLNAEIRIIPTLPTSSPIPLHRLSPSRSNIRVSSSSSESQQNQPLATPLYNTTLLLSLTPKPWLLSIYNLKQEVPAFADALALLRIWSNQRGFNDGSRLSVHGFQGRGAIWSALLDTLIHGEEQHVSGKKGSGPRQKPVGRGLSSYQLFKAALDLLSRRDFEKDPLITKSKGETGAKFTLEEYSAHHEAVLVDSTSLVNVLSGVPLSSLETLRHEATKTLETLNTSSSPSHDPFAEVFLKDKRDLSTRFDTVLRIDLTGAQFRNASVSAVLDHGSTSNALLNDISSILRRGLGNRSRCITLLRPSTDVRPLTQAHPSSPSIIYIGLVHDPENAFRLVDHGPAAASSEAAQDATALQEFRDLWGSKAELRRFKDGRIIESVIWDVKTSDERAQIPTMIVRHLLGHHFGLGEDGSSSKVVMAWQDAFDGVLRLPEDVVRLRQTGSAAVGFKGAMSAFDALVKAIKAVDGPLSVLSVSPVSEHLRYTSALQPLPRPPSSSSGVVSIPQSATYYPSMEIIIEFEHSSRWPDDLRAIQKMKLAFFEKMARDLMTTMPGTQADVVLADKLGVPDIQDRSFLSIVTPEGWAFRARIWLEREAVLLDRMLETKPALVRLYHGGELSPAERKDAEAAKEVYVRRFIHAPRHHRAIASLNHKFSSFSGTVRLVKRWLAAHWVLYGHVREEIIEIICAHAYLRYGSQSHAIPVSKEHGFAAVVAFLKEWKWEDGLFVPLYDEEQQSPAQTSKDIAVRGGSAQGVWTVSTQFDPSGRIWTSEGPELVSAHRIRALAKATYESLQAIEDGDLNVLALFTHPTNDYEFIIHLDKSVLPRYFHRVSADSSIWQGKGKYVNLRDQPDGQKNEEAWPDFDPAAMLFDDINMAYADTIKLFWDPYGGDRIGAVWDPSLKNSKPFRVFGGFNSVPIPKNDEKDKGREKDNSALVSLNRAAVLAEIERIGSGVVKKITVQS